MMCSQCRLCSAYAWAMWHACSLAAAITSRTDKAVKTVQVLLAEKEWKMVQVAKVHRVVGSYLLVHWRRCGAAPPGRSKLGL